MGKDSFTALLASTSDDSHMWNLTTVQLLLEERGFKVSNLGCCTPPELIAEFICDNRPDLAVISTVNGHGFDEGLRLAETLSEYQAFSMTKVVIGGNLEVGGGQSNTVRAALLANGFHGVFTGDAAWADFDRFLLKSGLVPIMVSPSTNPYDFKLN